MKLKKTIWMILVLAIMLSFLPSYEVKADTGWTLAQMKSHFAHGRYWNHLAQPGHGYNATYGWIHYGDACGDILFSVTDHPCYPNGVAPVGYYDCNTYYNKATQCSGFARLMADLAFPGATNIEDWGTVTDKGTAISVAKPGDVIHYYGGGASAADGHWAFIIGVSGDNLIFGECGVGDYCNISWGRSFNIWSASTVTLYRSPEVWTGYVDSYYLDLNGIIDGVSKDSTSGFGTADVYVNGALVADDVSDYYVAYTPGTTYEIKDIKTVGCYAYKGNASYSGTINSTTNINLEFVTAHDYKTTVIPPTCTEGEKSVKTCSKCGDSVTEDTSTNPVWSEWSTEKPDVDESRIESKLQYRYMKKEVKYSNETAIDGWIYEGRDWNEGVTSTVEYVENWPAGFDGNNALHAKYYKTAPSPSLTENEKVEVGNTVTAGYIYWHWCSSSYNGSYPINRYISDCYMSWDSATSRAYDIFHAFFSTEYKAVTAGKGATEYYNDGTCLQTYWWQPVLEVKKTSYTTYEKMNKFTRETGWSEWEDFNTAGRPSEDDTEFRTLYRYVISGFPATGHDWDSGVITKPATETESGIKLLKCKDCEATKEVIYNLDDYTCGDVNADGNINAADALLVLKHAAKIDLSNVTFIVDAAHTNADDNINAADALNILKYAARIIGSLPVK